MKKKICLYIVFAIITFFIELVSADAKAVMYKYCPNFQMQDLNNAGQGYHTIVNLGGEGFFINEYNSDNLYAPITRQNDKYCWFSSYNYWWTNSWDCDNKDANDHSIVKDAFCPLKGRYNSWGDHWQPNVEGTIFDFLAINHSLVLYEKEEAANIEWIEDDIYVFYTIEYDGEKIIVGEGYDDSTGEYYYINYGFSFDFSSSDLEPFGHLGKDAEEQFKYTVETIPEFYQLLSYTKNGINFFRLDDNIYNLFVFVSNYCERLLDCDDKGFKIIASSSDQKLIHEFLDNWYNDIGINFSKLIEYIDYSKDNDLSSTSEKLVNSVQNGSAYFFDDSYTELDLLVDLEKIYELLLLVDAERINFSFKDALNDKNNVSINGAAKSAVLKELFEIDTDDFNELTIGNGRNNGMTKLRKMLFDDIDEYIETEWFDKDSMGVANVYDYIRDDKQFKDDIEKYMNVTAYFNYMSSYTNLTSDEKERLSTLNDKMIDFAKEHGINPNFFSCSHLIGDALQEKIISYFNIIRIAIPILLIGLGVFDFTKAIFAGDEDTMKKAQKFFLTRIGIAVLFFLVPIFVNFILKIANSIWLTINPDTCIRF